MRVCGNLLTYVLTAPLIQKRQEYIFQARLYFTRFSGLTQNIFTKILTIIKRIIIIQIMLQRTITLI